MMEIGLKTTDMEKGFDNMITVLDTKEVGKMVIDMVSGQCFLQIMM